MIVTLPVIKYHNGFNRLLWYFVYNDTTGNFMKRLLPFRNCVPTENEPINIHF